MKRRNKQYLVEIYKGTTFLRLFLFLSIGVLTVNTLGVAPLWLLVGELAGLLILVVCLIWRLGDFWMMVAFILIAVGFGGIWSLREMPSAERSGVKRVEIISSQRGSGNHLACDARVAGGEMIRLNSDSDLVLRVGESITGDIRVYWPKYRGGEFNYPLYLYRKGYSGVAWLDSAKKISRKKSEGERMTLWRERCVNRFLEAGISEENLGIISAMTVGERSHLSENVTDDFRDAGVAHLLVVSGMHVGYIFLLFSLLYKYVRKKWVVVLVGICVMWVYAAVVGFTSPVCRAVLMFSLMLIIREAGGGYNSMSALALSAVVLMVANPLVIYDVGFQLSYLAVLSIIIFYPVFPEFGNLRWYVRLFYDAVRLSISAQMLVMPVVIYYFGQMPVYFLITNLATVLLTPMVFIGGMITLVPVVGNYTGGIVDGVVSLFRGIVEWVAGLPGATVEMERGSLLMMVCLVSVVIIGNILRSDGNTYPSETEYAPSEEGYMVGD